MNRGAESRDRGVTGAIETEREASHKATARAADPRAQRGREEARKAAV